MNIDVNEMFECTSKKSISCFILGCIYFDKKLNKFSVCKHFKLKKNILYIKNDSKNEVV